MTAADRRPLEKTIERAAVKALEARGCLTLKLEMMYNVGWPDRLIVMPNGRIFFIEFKRPGGKLTTLQAERHRQLKERGCGIYVCTSVIEAVEALCTEFGDAPRA